MMSAVVLALSTGTASASKTATHSGGTATFAESVDGPPLWIFPLYPGTDFTVQYQSQFEYLMVPPLYQFGSGSSPSINYKISLAYPPVYEDGDTKVVIKLKHYVWSDRTPLTARDVTFWMNILEAEKNNWAVYIPGSFPDNVTSIKINNPYQLTFTLNKAYSPTYYTDNELAQITPMPQQAWDRESATGAVGNYDETTAGAKSVFNFLNSQSKDISTYASNPLWKVVDGPWKLTGYSTSGRVVMTPNNRYSGPDKAHLSKLIFLPFDSEVSEVDALKAGTLDVGNLPADDVSLRSQLKTQGFTFAQWPTYGFNSLVINFHNPTVGPEFGQLYIRQALERLIDQPLMVKTALAGYGEPDYGPVVNGSAQQTAPIESPSNYPYAYSASAAETLLRDHGWKVIPDGVDSCTDPGTGSGQCGAGIAKGTKLTFNLIYQSATTFEQTEMAEYKSDAGRAGVQINLSSNVFPFQLAIPCTSTQADCNWQMIDWGGAIYTLPYYPAGGGYFECGGALNYDSYCSTREVALDDAAEASSAKLIPWETYVTKDLPMLWIPNSDFELLEVKSDLKGVLPANPLLSIYPQDWYFAKK
jgi:peptide/nickel transport system substrate-binding protein